MPEGSQGGGGGKFGTFLQREESHKLVIIPECHGAIKKSIILNVSNLPLCGSWTAGRGADASASAPAGPRDAVLFSGDTRATAALRSRGAKGNLASPGCDLLVPGVGSPLNPCMRW